MEIVPGIVSEKYKQGTFRTNYAFVQLNDRSYEIVSFPEPNKEGLQKRVALLQESYPGAKLQVVRCYASVDQDGATVLYAALSDLSKGKAVDLEHLLES
jgi:hypothetical protein